VKHRALALSLLTLATLSGTSTSTLAQSPSLRTVTLEVRDVSAVAGCDIEGFIIPPELYAEVFTQIPLAYPKLDEKTVKSPQTVRGKGNLNFKVTRTFAASQVPPEIRFQITLKDKDPLGDQAVDVNHRASHGKATLIYDFSTRKVLIDNRAVSQSSTGFNFTGRSASKCHGTLNVKLYEPGVVIGPSSPSDIVERER
jgi:hypothetical protein